MIDISVHDANRLKELQSLTRLSKTHPKQYDYCMRGGEWIDNPYYELTRPIESNGLLTTWNPKKVWAPSKDGLGMAKLFDMANEAMGEQIWRY